MSTCQNRRDLLLLVTLLQICLLALNVRCQPPIDELTSTNLFLYDNVNQGALLGPALGITCTAGIAGDCVPGTANTAQICCDEVHCQAGTIPTPIGKTYCCSLNQIACKRYHFDAAYSDPRETYYLYKIRDTATDIICTATLCKGNTATTSYLCDEKECWYRANPFIMSCVGGNTCTQSSAATATFCCDKRSCSTAITASSTNAQICCTKTGAIWSCAWQPGGFILVNGGLNVCNVNGCTRKLSTYAPLEWSATYPMCAGTRQSPINIRHKKTRKSSSKYRPINIRRRMIGMDWESEKWTMINEQLAVILKPVNVDHTVRLSSDRSDQYRLDSLIFRWGGSEHQINGRQFSMEAQLKFTRTDNPTKFAFISFLIDYAEKGTEQTHPMLDQIVRSLPSIKAENSKVDIFFQLRKLFPLKLKKYYVYTGSLTMPDCSEGVKWFVARNRVSFKVSQTEINAFQSIENLFNKRVLTNSRPVQSSNGRKIYRSF